MFDRKGGAGAANSLLVRINLAGLDEKPSGNMKSDFSIAHGHRVPRDPRLFQQTCHIGKRSVML